MVGHERAIAVPQSTPDIPDEIVFYCDEASGTVGPDREDDEITARRDGSGAGLLELEELAFGDLGYFLANATERPLRIATDQSPTDGA